MLTALKVLVIHDRIGNTSDEYSHKVISEIVDEAIREKTQNWKEIMHYGNPISVRVIEDECNA